ncbi:hypothetical protein VSDG_06641 [Cytospora chrysosperma]|uniref:Uncharacterized protein n=1 Tax=Cytospora chrysosperma TaxID=252740 RepID=A0A423VNF1_CYTCH|nr:hypothetical protein VSDG_06641 [Valsa sordida]
MRQPAGRVPSLIFCAGQTATGEIKQATSLKQVLWLAGSSIEKIVKINVYLASMQDFAAMNEAYIAFLPYQCLDSIIVLATAAMILSTAATNLGLSPQHVAEQRLAQVVGADEEYVDGGTPITVYRWLVLRDNRHVDSEELGPMAKAMKGSVTEEML